MSQEINIQGDKTGQNNRLIHRFIALLFAVPAFTECMRQPMKAITSFFRSPDNHVLDFQDSLQEIYNAYIKDNCAPTFITANAKYLPPHPQVALTKGLEMHMNRGIQDRQNKDTSEDDQLHKLIIAAARPTIPPSQHKAQYTPSRCKVCGKSQKEVHEMLRQIHDPNDPHKCCFRGAKFIGDKHMREAVMQYNLKNPGPPPPPTDLPQDTNPPSQPSFRKPTANSIMSVPVPNQERAPSLASQHCHGTSAASSTAMTSENQEQINYKKEEEATIQVIIRELEQNQEMKELHQPT